MLKIFYFWYKFILENNENAKFLSANEPTALDRTLVQRRNMATVTKKRNRDEPSITKYHMKSYGSLSILQQGPINGGGLLGPGAV